MNFRLKADMYVIAPKVQLAHYTDNTMPRRNWSRYDMPSELRLPSRAECAANFREACALRYLRQAS